MEPITDRRAGFPLSSPQAWLRDWPLAPPPLPVLRGLLCNKPFSADVMRLCLITRFEVWWWCKATTVC
ncbi:hypothetical protein chiPu_0020521 [Chiloscyllium punctatum]|uniref:Uncharacterized protein n=1 Tax=Chiloscyllium punctatum TaxID=137246 RepID=A0A401RGM0_CHIPU|nr:hypothetical protein [Chiloscyllium punctatum]